MGLGTLGLTMTVGFAHLRRVGLGLTTDGGDDDDEGVCVCVCLLLQGGGEVVVNED